MPRPHCCLHNEVISGLLPYSVIWHLMGGMKVILKKKKKKVCTEQIEIFAGLCSLQVLKFLEFSKKKKLLFRFCCADNNHVPVDHKRCIFVKFHVSQSCPELKRAFICVNLAKVPQGGWVHVRVRLGAIGATNMPTKPV